jgi:hippurate hydrolase
MRPRLALFVLPVLLITCCRLTFADEASRSATISDPTSWAERHVDDLIPLYQHFHQNPELSLQEEQTSARFAEELQSAGVAVRTGIGGYGVVGMLHNGNGKLLLLRTDLDALPVTEETGVEYASRVRVKNPNGSGEVGVMHACGHDIHMTSLVGVARYLVEHKSLWQGSVMFIGQPAEERVQGAKAMLDAGLYEQFGKPSFAVALHVSSDLAAGKVGYRAGYSLANVDSVDITVRGVSGHGAAPHMTVDPIVQAAQLVLALQTIVSREVDPIEPSVITVGSIHAGTKHNIIPDSCHLQLTVRTYSPAVRAHILKAIQQKAKGVAIAAGAPEPEVKFSEGTDAVLNDAALVTASLPALKRALGEENVIEMAPVMGAEDFGLFSRGGVPVFMYRLGAIAEDRLAALDRPISLHSSVFYPDARPTLVAGISSMSAVAVKLLER